MEKCLLIIDVQQGFINKSTTHIPLLVGPLQSKYTHVYVTRFFNEEDSFFRKLIKWNRLHRDSKDFQLAFKPLEKAIIIDKKIYSCVSSAFIQELNRNKIDKVDICGIDTDICVTKCAVDLFEAGIIPRVLSSYCASNAGSKTHGFALKTLKRFIGTDQVI